MRKSRRRYGGYIVHVGIGLMFLGFCGKAWDVEKEASLMPGQSAEVGGYKLTYRGSRREVDLEKRMIFADMDVERGRPGAVAGPPGQVHLQRVQHGPHHRGVAAQRPA